MWLSQQMRPAPEDTGADLGVTSISGSSAGVIAKGELRSLPVYGPGGYLWQPAAGQTVLVIKGGTGAQECCVAGAKQAPAPTGMQPGEVYLYAGDGSIYLKNDGTVVLRGTVSVEGTLMINGETCNPSFCQTEGTT